MASSEAGHSLSGADAKDLPTGNWECASRQPSNESCSEDTLTRPERPSPAPIQEGTPEFDQEHWSLPSEPVFDISAPPRADDHKNNWPEAIGNIKLAEVGPPDDKESVGTCRFEKNVIGRRNSKAQSSPDVWKVFRTPNPETFARSTEKSPSWPCLF